MTTNPIITKQIFDQVAALCDMGVSIAKVENEYFTYLTFVASSSGNTSSIDFVTIQGICITEFITTTKLDPSTRAEVYFQQFERYIEPLISLTIKFNKSISYILFSK